MRSIPQHLKHFQVLTWYFTNIFLITFTVSTVSWYIVYSHLQAIKTASMFSVWVRHALAALHLASVSLSVSSLPISMSVVTSESPGRFYGSTCFSFTSRKMYSVPAGSPVSSTNLFEYFTRRSLKFVVLCFGHKCLTLADAFDTDRNTALFNLHQLFLHKECIGPMCFVCFQQMW